MKKSQAITLVLITSALASCHKDKQPQGPNVYMRGDSTATYAHTHHHYHSSGFMWFYAFRPYGYYDHGSYQRAGYYSSSIPQSSNIGRSTSKANVMRGGFGHGGFSVSS